MPKRIKTGQWNFGLKTEKFPDVASGVIIAYRSKGDGKDRVEVEIGRVTYTVTDFPANVRVDREIHGFQKTLMDNTSEMRLNSDADCTARLDEMQTYITLFKDGKLEKPQGERKPAVVAIEVQAIAELKGCTVPEVQKAMQGWTKDKRQAAYANPAVQAKVKEIQSREAHAVTLDDLVPPTE